MGAVYSRVVLRIRARNLPSDPLLWTEANIRDAAAIMFEHYDTDNNASVDSVELRNLFQDCGLHLANFGTGKLDLSANLDELIVKYDKDKSRNLCFKEFLPLFREMVGRMAEDGFLAKNGVLEFSDAVQKAVAETHVLIISLDYNYNKELTLTGITDGQAIEKMARKSGVKDITTLFDNLSFKHKKFPLKDNIRKYVEQIGKRCKPNDVFFFFFSGHGLHIPDANADEKDGRDEAFGTPNKKGAVDVASVLIDDDFARYLDEYIPKSTRILLVTDCCHSGTLADVDSFAYKHEILHISAARDSETSLDMSTFGHKGGVLTCAIGDTIKEFAKERRQEVAVADVFNGCVGKVAKIIKVAKHKQKIGVQYKNIQPHEFPWPFLPSS